MATLKSLATSPLNDIMIQSFANILTAYFKSKQVVSTDKEVWMSDLVILLEKSSKSFSIISITNAIIQANSISGTKFNNFDKFIFRAKYIIHEYLYAILEKIDINYCSG